MAGVQLYDGLIKATEQIVAQFGKDVLTEERFVNILHDLYPDRDNPAIYIIVKSIVNDGISTELLNTKKRKVEAFLSKSSAILAKKYGYDKQLVEGVIYSIAVGCKKMQHLQTKVPKPAKQKTSKTNLFKQLSKIITSLSWSRLYDPFYLAIAFFGLFIAPVVYLLAITGTWWPSFTLFLILIIQAILFTISYNKLIKHKPLPGIGGSFSAIILCAVIFFAFAPFHADDNSTKEVIYFLGISYNHDMAFPIVSLAISMFYLGFVNVGGIIAGYDLTLIFDNLDNTNLFRKTKINKLLSDKQFMKGFILSGLFIWLVGAFIMYLPTIDSWRIDINNSLLRHNRGTEYRQLSFAGFMVGSDLDSCVQMANSSSEYYKLSGEESINYNIGILESEDEYSALFDSTIYIRTKWYSDSVYVALCSLKGKIMAIDVSTGGFNQDSILTLFSSKYGKPEYERTKDEVLYKYYYMYDESWQWTFQNGIIKVIPGHIRYLDRQLETIAAQRNKEEEQEELKKQIRQQKEEQKEKEKQRKKDSINKIKQVEEEKRKEKERKRAIDQI